MNKGDILVLPAGSLSAIGSRAGNMALSRLSIFTLVVIIGWIAVFTVASSIVGAYLGVLWCVGTFVPALLWFGGFWLLFNRNDATLRKMCEMFLWGAVFSCVALVAKLALVAVILMNITTHVLALRDNSIYVYTAAVVFILLFVVVPVDFLCLWIPIHTHRNSSAIVNRYSGFLYGLSTALGFSTLVLTLQVCLPVLFYTFVSMDRYVYPYIGYGMLDQTLVTMVHCVMGGWIGICYSSRRFRLVDSSKPDGIAESGYSRWKLAVPPIALFAVYLLSVSLLPLPAISVNFAKWAPALASVLLGYTPLPYEAYSGHWAAAGVSIGISCFFIVMSLCWAIYQRYVIVRDLSHQYVEAEITELEVLG